MCSLCVIDLLEQFLPTAPECSIRSMVSESCHPESESVRVCFMKAIKPLWNKKNQNRPEAVSRFCSLSLCFKLCSLAPLCSMFYMLSGFFFISTHSSIHQLPASTSSHQTLRATSRRVTQDKNVFQTLSRFTVHTHRHVHVHTTEAQEWGFMRSISLILTQFHLWSKSEAVKTDVLPSMLTGQMVI